MYCLKCGRETEVEKIFCEECLQTMDKYPVKPGTAIHLPRRDTPAVQKKTARIKHSVGTEEQVIYLKKVIRWMKLLLAVAVVALAIAISQLLFLL